MIWLCSMNGSFYHKVVNDRTGAANLRPLVVYQTHPALIGIGTFARGGPFQTTVKVHLNLAAVSHHFDVVDVVPRLSLPSQMIGGGRFHQLYYCSRRRHSPDGVLDVPHPRLVSLIDQHNAVKLGPGVVETKDNACGSVISLIAKGNVGFQGKLVPGLHGSFGYDQDAIVRVTNAHKVRSCLTTSPADDFVIIGVVGHELVGVAINVLLLCI